MWNKPISETELLAWLLETLRASLPAGWKADPILEPKGPRDQQPDALFTIRSPDGEKATIVVEVKNQVEPKNVSSLLAQVRRYASAFDADQALVAAPYLGARAREQLAKEGAAFADATGNWRLWLSKPGLFIERAGADTNPWPEERILRSLKGPSAGRAVRALCDFRTPYGIRELADRSKTALASVARVVDFLERDGEGIVIRELRGPVTAVDWRALIGRWTKDYSFTRSNRTRTYLEPRGLTSLQTRLRDVDTRAVVTGSLAAVELGPAIAAGRLAMVYVDSVPDAASKLQLRETDEGANVILAEPFDDVVFDRTVARDGFTVCSPSQVAADLLTGPGRSPAEGEALLDWMQENEDAWRS